ncbi:putative NADH-flavin reductase [Kitasatospora sp. MAA4]|uniref:NAD(P)-dependent oxidoreductase n=1 Tax=Kitasatospora sp. MAA4 TaxID=3035093 RepID=UPI0024743489|nr:NAD(P)H-binding protein [Kitasatospora sp. MAA4]MDH6137617.1 putative NADH-flavin reductase [Kitasatospora sp. MAA4]
MRITILAATGGIGSHLLDQALAAGHEVTAVVRSPQKLPATRARVVAADLADPDPAALRTAVEGADAVLSGLGPRSKSDAEAGVVRRGTSAAIAAMREAGVRRLVVVSAAPVGTVPSPARPNPPRHDPGDGFLLRTVAYPVLKAALRPNYADLARMEDALRDSGLDWTAVRPVRLTDQPLTGHYRTAQGRNLRHGLLISRADVAHCMLAALDRPDSIGRTIGIAR